MSRTSPYISQRPINRSDTSKRVNSPPYISHRFTLCAGVQPPFYKPTEWRRRNTKRPSAADRCRLAGPRSAAEKTFTSKIEFKFPRLITRPPMSARRVRAGKLAFRRRRRGTGAGTPPRRQHGAGGDWRAAAPRCHLAARRGRRGRSPRKTRAVGKTNRRTLRKPDLWTTRPKKKCRYFEMELTIFLNSDLCNTSCCSRLRTRGLKKIKPKLLTDKLPF